MAGKNFKRDLQMALNFERKTRDEAKAVVAELSRAAKQLERARKAAGKARAPRKDPGLASWLTADLRKVPAANDSKGRVPKPAKTKKAPKAKKAGPAPRHSLKVGQWLVSTWGYEQTNASFFQVVGVSEYGVKLQKYETIDTWKMDKGINTMTGTAVPGSKAVGQPRARKVIASYSNPHLYNEVKVGDSEGFAHPWDGKPVSVSSYG